MPTFAFSADEVGRFAGFSPPDLLTWIPCTAPLTFARFWVKPSRIPGRQVSKFAPVNREGVFGKFRAEPTGTPGIPGKQLTMEVPVKVWRPRPGGPSSARSGSRGGEVMKS